MRLKVGNKIDLKMTLVFSVYTVNLHIFAKRGW